MSLSQEEDWPDSIPHKSLFRQLDESAQCTICHDVFKVPLSLSCGHSWCSGCIRSNLEFQERTDRPKCPLCRKPATAQDLRPNIALTNLAQQYMAVRGALIEFAAQATAQQAGGGPEVYTARGRSRAESTLQRDGSLGEGGGRGPPGVPGQGARDLERQSSGSQQAQRAQRSRVLAAPDVSKRMSNGEDVSEEPSRRLRKRKVSDAGLAKDAALEELEELDDASDKVLITLSDSDFSPEPSPLKRPRPSMRAPAPPAAKPLHAGPPPRTTAGPPVTDGAGSRAARVTPPVGSARVSNGDGNASAAAEITNGSQQEAGSGAPGDPPVPVNPPAPGYVHCPICTMTIHENLLNLHLDTCLKKGNAAPAGNAAPIRRGVPRLGPSDAKAAKGKLPKSPVKLQVPATLVFTFLKDAQVREALKKYHLPTMGKRAELEQRYRDFRVAVQKANDAGEVTTYKALAKQWMAKAAAEAAATSCPMPVQAPGSTDKDAALFDTAGASFEDLIRITRERQAHLKNNNTPSATDAADVGDVAPTSPERGGAKTLQRSDLVGTTGSLQPGETLPGVLRPADLCRKPQSSSQDTNPGDAAGGSLDGAAYGNPPEPTLGLVSRPRDANPGSQAAGGTPIPHNPAAGSADHASEAPGDRPVPGRPALGAVDLEAEKRPTPAGHSTASSRVLADGARAGNNVALTPVTWVSPPPSSGLGGIHHDDVGRGQRGAPHVTTQGSGEFPVPRASAPGAWMVGVGGGDHANCVEESGTPARRGSKGSMSSRGASGDVFPDLLAAVLQNPAPHPLPNVATAACLRDSNVRDMPGAARGVNPSARSDHEHLPAAGQLCTGLPDQGSGDLDQAAGDTLAAKIESTGALRELPTLAMAGGQGVGSSGGGAHGRGNPQHAGMWLRGAAQPVADAAQAPADAEQLPADAVQHAAEAVQLGDVSPCSGHHGRDAQLDDIISDSESDHAQGAAKEEAGPPWGVGVLEAMLSREGDTDDDDGYGLPDAPYGCSQPPPGPPSRPLLRSSSRLRS